MNCLMQIDVDHHREHPYRLRCSCHDELLADTLGGLTTAFRTHVDEHLVERKLRLQEAR